MNKVTIYTSVQGIFMDILKSNIEEDTVTLTAFWDGEAGHNYQAAGQFFTTLSGIDAAEEAFDLSNNPSRQDERLLVQGYSRSLSVGDVVKIVDYSKADSNLNFKVEYYICLNMGWEKL